MVMASQTLDTLIGNAYYPLQLRSMYSDGVRGFVFGAFSEHARAEVVASAQKMQSNSMGGVDMMITYGGESKRVMLTGAQGIEGSPRRAAFGNASITVAYGAKRRELPFSIQLRDFIMERYPGTNNASSYASEVTLIDNRHNIQRQQRIYMNHILNYDGYRFFQSSYDQDELGTYLSVNHDAPGTIISYIGYALLTLGMIMALVSKNTRFAQLGDSLKKMRRTAIMIVMLIATWSVALSQASNIPPTIVEAEHAKAFGELVVQDFQGRFKPMNTFTNEVVRKLSRTEKLMGLRSEQVVLGMATNPKDWYHVPMIKLGKHEEIRLLLGTQEEIVKYSDFFTQEGMYKLRDQVRTAYNTPQRDRSMFDKEIIKLDEKINICGFIYSGRFMKMFPVANDTTHTWLSAVPDEPLDESLSQTIIGQFYPIYINGIQNALTSNDWAIPNRAIQELALYQREVGAAIIPSKSKLNAELLLNRLNVFNRLGAFYGLLSLFFLALLFTGVFLPDINLKTAGKVVVGLFVVGFAFHTLGLGLRWYVSGRAPWSNGYESMIYIGWTTTLAGLIFARKSFGGLAATAVLAAVILLVAAMNWLDPEITPLVPVLKSYWLMIHVSLEAGSYGFLALGAVIGVLNLVL
ncbi:MAG: cytochrome c biogenesis protein ResB [Saprospiraceae bacterium]